ncbi:phage major capsid protein [Bordetella genomosp. 9]|uniref:Phage major capsid protein n=2 Tax=Bordetella genomosp. 9 TaxID=1416803 RepID=A0A1W6YXU1_9BORD|nr:phage major capsid protein [Bordetella genomosp. 9]
MNLAQIREARAAKTTEMRGILAKAEAEKRNLNDAEKSAFDKLKAEVTDLEGDEQRAAFMAEQERRMSGEPITPHGDKSLAELEKRVSVVASMRAQMEGRSLDGAEREYSQEIERRTGRKAQGAFVPMSALEQRVNTTTSASDLVPTDHRADLYIGPLRESLVARKLGVRVLTGLRGNLSIPKYGSGLETGWVAEGQAVPEGNMAFDSVGLTPKHVGGKTEMSRQLLQQSSPDIEQLVRDDLAFLIAKQLDRAIIAGTGTNNEPLGVLHAPGTQTFSLATLDWATVLTMVEAFEDTELTNGTWLTSVGVKRVLSGTLKETGLPGYLLQGGQLAEYPLRTTRQLPVDAGKGTAILGDWSQVLLGVWSELDVLVNPYAEPAYSRGGVQVRAMATADVAIRYPEAFVIANDVAVPPAPTEQ